MKVARLLGRGFSAAAARVSYVGGQSRLSADTRDVELRGIRVQGNHADLPHLLFFPDYFDSAENWLPFFLSPRSRVLDHRNVFILYPRNFGSSDHCDDAAGQPEDLAADVERFMYAQRISTATLGGHGFGARTAALAACYRHRLVTGLVALDYAPQDYTHFEVARRLRALVALLAALDCRNMSLARLRELLAAEGVSPKLQGLVAQCLRRSVGGNAFTFNLPFLAAHLPRLLDWQPHFGLYPGRACFVFPEHSSHVFLGSNTVAMHRVCPRVRPMEHDIFPLRGGNDNPELNHWLYEDAAGSAQADALLTRFLAHFDGVHALLHDRQEVAERVGVPTIPHERADMHSGKVAPAHYHHNWRFRAER